VILTRPIRIGRVPPERLFLMHTTKKWRRSPLAAAAMLALAGALALSGCTSGLPSDGGGGGDDGQAASGNGGLPLTVDVTDARAQLLAAVEGKQISYIPLSLNYPLNRLWGNVLRDTFMPLGVDYTEDDAGGEVDKAIQFVDSRLNEGADVIIVQNPDVGVLSEQVRKGREQGTYFVSLNIQGSESSDAYVGPDFVGMARDLAQRMVADCQAKGKNKVAIVSGYGTDAQSIFTDQGWEPVFKDAGIEVVSKQQSEFLPTNGNQIATTVLQQNPDLCGFAVIFDGTAIGVADAVDAAGKSGEVGVYTIGASNDTCVAIDSGRITAAIDGNQEALPAAAAAAAQQLLLIGDPPGTRRVMSFIGHNIVDAASKATVPGACYKVG
jgi:ribose transport system substrate-binding protein